MAAIEALYKDFGVLADAKDKAGEHTTEYTNILNAVKGESNEKRLASQFIARFFKFFPKMSEKAIDALMDLCEDEDVMTRRQAIKDLPSLCKDNKENVLRISDVLVQLLVSDDPVEQSLVRTALFQCFKTDPKAALGGVFSQIVTGVEEVRDAAIKFMSTKMKTLPEELLTIDLENYLVDESKKVLEDVTGDEFVAFMTILTGLQTTSTVQGRQQLVDIVTNQAGLGAEFQATDPDYVDRLIQCTKQAMPFFSKNVHSTTFVVYMCDHVVPALSQVKNSVEGQDTQLEILKLFSEMVSYCGELADIETNLNHVFTKLIEYMPLPADTDTEESKDQPQLQFSYVECLMYAFHILARKKQEFLASEENAERLKDFRLRLQYFARGVQVYIKQLRLALQGKTGEALKTDENKLKVVALKTTSNINNLIKDLFHNPPSFKSTVSLSWKPIAKAPVTSPTAGQKRSGITPITYDSSTPAKKTDRSKGSHDTRDLYSPPTGKFSEKAGTYSENGGFRGRGRGRGGRGRGFRGRRW